MAGPIMPVLQATHEPEEELTWLFEPDYDIVGYADIHRPGLRSLRSAPKLLFSIGSVGNSLGLSMVQYAILQCEMGADPAPLDLNFILLPYDQERAALRCGERAGHAHARGLSTGNPHRYIRTQAAAEQGQNRIM